MQPQTTNPQPPPPSAPGQFDFMMKDQPKPPGRVGSLLSGIPRPVKIALAALVALIVLIILYSVVFGGKTTNVDQLTAVAARAQEISRVSALAQSGSQNADTIALAATTDRVMVSQEQQIKSYFKASKAKIDNKKLAAKLDKKTDTALTAAQQNNNYDQAYFSYLKASLLVYQNDIATANQGASKKAQVILSDANQSAKTLLSSPQLK